MCCADLSTCLLTPAWFAMSVFGLAGFTVIVYGNYQIDKSCERFDAGIHINNLIEENDYNGMTKLEYQTRRLMEEP